MSKMSSVTTINIKDAQDALKKNHDEDEDSVLELGQIALLVSSKPSLKQHHKNFIEGLNASIKSLNIREDILSNSKQFMNSIGIDGEKYKELVSDINSNEAAQVPIADVIVTLNEHNNCLTRFISQFKGYLLGILSAFMFCLSQVTLRRAKWLSCSDHMFIRHLTTFIFMYIILKYKNLDTTGPRKQLGLLVLRGNLGSFAIAFLYIAIILIDPSDIVSLSHTSLIMTAVMAKLFLKEKLTLAHFSAIIFTACGILLISKPEFLFHRNKHVQHTLTSDLIAECRNFSNNESKIADCIQNIQYELKMKNLKLILGISFTILSAFLTSSTHLLIKKLNKSKVHWAVNTTSVSWFGIPLSIVMSFLMVKFHYAHSNFEQEKKDLPMDLFYSIIASILSNTGQVLLNISLQYEEAIKIAITRTVDVFFAFVLQFVLLGIIPDYLSVIGAMLIITGTFFILIFKILEFKYEKFKLKQSIKYANYVLSQPANSEIKFVKNKKKTIRNNLLKSFFFEF